MVVVASKSYKPGDLVFEVKPLVYALVMPEKGKRCDSCFRRPAVGAILKQCARCLKVWYCNNACQLSDWLLHKLECPLFVNPRTPRHFFDSDDQIMPFLLRFVLLYKAKPMLFLEKHQALDGKLHSFWDLIHTPLPEEAVGEVDSLRLLIASTLYKFGIEYDATVNQLYHVAALYNHMIQIPRTETNLVSQWDSVMASSLSLGSPKHLLDHSCRPSLFEVLDGRNTRLIAAKSIEIGEKLTYSHVYLCQSKADRQKHLELLFDHGCPCDRCRAGEDLDALGSPIDYDVVNRLNNEPTDKKNYQRLLTMSRGKPKLIIDRIYLNEYPEKTILLISLVKTEFALKKKKKTDASLIRATIKSMQLTMPNNDVMKFDPEKDDVEKMAQYLVEFAPGQ